MNIGFIGLGVIGGPVAGHLVRHGHRVRIYNRGDHRRTAWLETYAGEGAASPAAVAQGAEVVFICVGGDADVAGVSRGEQGLLAGLAPGVLVVDHTTTSPRWAEEFGGLCQAHGASLLDAPVSGGQVGAEEGRLAIMVGGAAGDFARALPLLQAYGAHCVHMGPQGHGQLAKMANQMAIAGVLQGLSEALVFGERSGLDGEKLIAILSQGAAGSWQCRERGRSMLAGSYDFGFASRWMAKDLSYAVAEAKRRGSPTPHTQQVLAAYQELARDPRRAQQDTSVLIEVVRALGYEASGTQA